MKFGVLGLDFLGCNRAASGWSLDALRAEAAKTRALLRGIEQDWREPERLREAQLVAVEERWRLEILAAWEHFAALDSREQFVREQSALWFGKDFQVQADVIALLRQQLRALSWLIRLLLRVARIRSASQDRVMIERQFFQCHGLGRPPQSLGRALVTGLSQTIGGMCSSPVSA